MIRKGLFCIFFSFESFAIQRLLGAHSRISSSAVGNFLDSKRKAVIAQCLKIFEAVLPLLEGNMLYFLSVVSEENLDLRYRQILLTIRLNIAKYFNIQSLHFACVIQTVVLLSGYEIYYWFSCVFVRKLIRARRQM